MENNNTSSTNTILIVVVLLLIVGFGVWWFTNRSAPKDDGAGLDIDVNLPTNGPSSDGSSY